MRICTVIFLLLLFSISVSAQETLKYADLDKAYRLGIELYDQGQYLAAQKSFEKVLSLSRATPAEQYLQLRSDAAFYDALAAAELGDPGAEQKLRSFTVQFPGSNKSNLAYFTLGKISYRNKKYSNAIEWFNRVDQDALSNEDMIDFSFQLGYSYFIRKKLDLAKPLLHEVKSVDSKYFYPANYYYGFICFYQRDYNEALTSFEQVKESVMFAAVTPFYIAQIYYYKKNYDNVIAYVNESLQAEGVKYKKDMALLLGKAYFEKQRYEESIRYLGAYVDNSRRVDKTDVYQLGYAHYMNYDYAKAIDYLVELDRETDSLGQNALYVLADCYMQLDDRLKARDAFQKAASLGHDQTITEASLINYAKLSYELDFHKSAISTLDAFLRERPDAPNANEAKELLADVFLATRNFSEALKVIEGLDFSNPRILAAYQKISYYKAIELYNDQKFDQCLELLQQSLETPVDLKIQALSHYLMGEVNYRNNSYDAAKANYTYFLQLVDLSEIREHEASPLRANYNLGYCHLKEKAYAAALSNFDKALQQFKASTDVVAKDKIRTDLLMRKADCHLMLKQYSLAAANYGKVIDENKSGVDYALLQRAIIEDLENDPRARIETLRSLVGRFPNSIYADDALFGLGSTYQDVGDFNEALNTFDQLIKSFPESAFARKSYLKAGLIHYNSGEETASLSRFKRVIELYPESTEAREALKAMKEVYVAQGNPEGYISYVEQLPEFDISTSEQDTILYQSAEEFYLKSNCLKAVEGFTRYLNKFPKGSFHLAARFYRGDCHFKAKNYEPALQDFEQLSNAPGNRFYEQALLKTAGLYYYEFQNYAKSVSYLSSLLEVSSNKEDRQFALTGLTRSHYLLGNDDQTLQYADRVIQSNLSTEQEIAEARFYQGKIYYKLKLHDEALKAFEKTATFFNSEKGAESKYHIAMIYFLQQNYETSLKECFEAKNLFANYEFWVVKTFILMADNYFKMDNTFQAKATLESIIANYKGDQSLVDQAKRKLDFIMQYEDENSRIWPDDSDRDSIIIMKDEQSLNK